MNEFSLIRMDNKISNFLGEISYGIYMYHMLVVFSIILVLKKYMVHLSLFSSSILFYLIVTTGVLIVSHLSKKWIEDQFLKLKAKFNG